MSTGEKEISYDSKLKHGKVIKSDLWKFSKYTVYATVTDGNCAYDALSQQLKFIDNVAKSAAEIRQEVVSYMRDNPVMNAKLTADILDEVQPQQYLKKMGSGNSWGDGIMLSAASTLYNKSVKVVLQDGKEFRIGSEFAENGTLTLGYVSSSGNKSLDHFVSLVPNDHRQEPESECSNISQTPEKAESSCIQVSTANY